MIDTVLSWVGALPGLGLIVLMALGGPLAESGLCEAAPVD
ncbi:hypothetical protein LX83_003081 [Goodfellowiella coeruleoviolacea]|uniref:Uncharacterized protein n=1 Tax=Goodfellowiella coeruleoviolacea TaxID=334858 RepID=A0AAE3KGT4_9PSEU|nr:hypothetical protein [Goodfellowiella coeruleoviolacea]